MTRKRRQLVTNLTAKPANGQHKKPCDDCPFARHSINGWLGSLTAEEWIRVAHGEARVECHMHTGVDCAGLAIYQANVCKTPRDPAALILPVDHISVFSSSQEFLDHHKRRPLNMRQRNLLRRLCDLYSKGLRYEEAFKLCGLEDLNDLKERKLIEQRGRGRNVGVFLTMPPDKLKRVITLPDTLREQRKTKDPKDQDVCAKLDCRAPCDAEDFCHGCGFFICNECDAGHLPMGQHDVIEHWEEP